MPIEIIRQDITKMRCDAIVCPTNSDLIADGGVDLLIRQRAGGELDSECEKIKPISVGESKITKGYKLPCKYIIHTVGPVWQGGNFNEREHLEECYKGAFNLARLYNLQSIAFPLISSGSYGYPKSQVLRVAMDTLGKLVNDYEIQVYIVVYDKDSYEISEKLYRDIASYIDDNLLLEVIDCQNMRIAPIRKSRRRVIGGDMPKCSLEDFIKHMDKGFAQTLFSYIDKKGLTDVECYKRANVDKKTFSKIICNQNYKPSKKTAIAFAIALKLDLQETEHLLRTAGMTLSKSNLFDVIIEYFITTGNYNNIFDVNEVLYKYDQATLGV